MARNLNQRKMPRNEQALANQEQVKHRKSVGRKI